MGSFTDVGSRNGDAISMGGALGEASATVGHTTFTIGDLSREFGVTLRALRFYENKGLLTPRREGLARIYDAGDRARLAVILKGKRLGFTLSEIRQMIAARESTASGEALTLTREKCLEQIKLLEKQRNEIEAALAELRQTYTSLSSIGTASSSA
jgi:DNA-binding transcriptional MerR regulator